jgi:ribosomal protein S16
MILIRLKRRSLGDQLTYSIVVSSHQVSPNSGKFLEKIGYYKPLVDR